MPLVGDWDGDGTDTVGLYAPDSSTFFLNNANATRNADIVFGFGPGGLGWMPLVGDWDGDGDDTVGLYAPDSSTFFLNNANATRNADTVFGFGPGGLGWMPLVADWDGDGVDTAGLYAPDSSFFFLNNANATRNADSTFGYGPAGLHWKPLVGDWQNLGGASLQNARDEAASGIAPVDTPAESKVSESNDWLIGLDFAAMVADDLASPIGAVADMPGLLPRLAGLDMTYVDGRRNPSIVEIDVLFGQL